MIDDLILYSPTCPQIRALDSLQIDELEVENFKLEENKPRRRLGSFCQKRKIKYIRKIARRKGSIKIE